MAFDRGRHEDVVHQERLAHANKVDGWGVAYRNDALTCAVQVRATLDRFDPGASAAHGPGRILADAIGGMRDAVVDELDAAVAAYDRRLIEPDL